MLLIFIRTLVLIGSAMGIMRLMGKKEIGQLQPYELVIAICIADLAAAPASNTGVPLLYGIIPMLGLLIIHSLLTFASIKSPLLRKLINGKPSIVINKGIIDEAELRKLGYNLNDLMEQLRMKEVFDIRDAEFAILEPSGNLSVMKKSDPETNLPAALIFDGKPHLKTTGNSNIDEKWLDGQVRRAGFTGISSVFYASLDDTGTLFMQGKIPDNRSVFLKTKEQAYDA
ncbi:MAG: DUF421 domain-containing protein [Christensenellales bacterium]|jgi:uncharacterized membrane protein YcaP (DUF421 family)